MNDFMDRMHDLVAFVRVAEAGSFSKAAQQLAMTPSAVSRQVARLEQALGVKLMHRTTRQLRLTDAGLDVLERGREMVAAARATLQVAEDHMRTPKGRVRLSAPKAFARQVLHQPLLAFMARYPEVEVQLIVADRSVDALREGVDLVVRLTDDPPPGMVARPLMPVLQWLVASPDYLASRGAVAQPEDLMHHSCLALGEQARDNRWCFVQGAETRAVLVQGRYTVNHSEMRLAAAEAGLGIACVPDFVARASAAAGRVLRVLPEWRFESSYQGTAYLLFPASRHMAPKLRVLIAHLLESVAAVAAHGVDGAA
jgi:DNA-binding transcriptional LysR family regulator